MKHIELQRVAPADIEARSMELIGQELGERVFPAEQLPVVKRVIHTTADFEYADNLVFSAGAVEAGIAAIRQGCTIVTDTQMAFSGVNKRVLEKFGGRAVCFMSDPDVAAEAKARGETRATVSMERAARLEGPLVLAWSSVCRWASSTWWRARSCCSPWTYPISWPGGGRAAATWPPPSATPCSIRPATTRGNNGRDAR